MKFISQLKAGLLCAGLLVAASAEEPVKFNIPGVANPPAGQPPVVAAPAVPAAPKFTEAQIFEAYGWYAGLQMGLNALEFTPEQVAAMARGLAHAATGDQPPAEFQNIGPEIEVVLGKKKDNFLTKLRTRNLNESAVFFTKLKENKNVQELPSGLRYETIKPGTGASPKAGQIVKMNYTGSFINGQVFDSSVSRNEPIEMLLRMPSKEFPEGTIAGMFEGLQKMNLGGKFKLYVPPHLAYGDAGTQGIPPAATLIFEIELLEVKDAPPQAPASAK